MSKLLSITVGGVLWAWAGYAAADAAPDCMPLARTSGVPEKYFWDRINQRVAALGSIANGSDSVIDDIRQAPDEARDAAIARASDAVAGHVDCLARNYGGLSGEQQRAVNTGSQIVTITAGGGLLSGAYPVVQRAFGYAAFTPILINQISALEPKRDLFAGARIGLNRIAERYVALQQASDAVAEIDTTEFGRRIDDGCKAVWDLLGRAEPAAPAAGASASSGVVIAEAQRLGNQCETLHRVNADHQLIQQDISLLRGEIPRHYAADVFAFHDNLQQRHREMLFTPTEALTAILASPFRAADQLLTGENGQQAEEQIRTQRAFEGLNQVLTPLAHRLTRPQAAALDPIPTPDALKSGAGVVAIRESARVIDALRGEQRRDRTRVLQLLEAAERTELNFNYSATAGAVRISLDKPTPPVTP